MKKITLAEIRKYANHKKVYFELNRYTGIGILFLGQISREKGSRKGSGASVMRKIMRYARQQKRDLVLYPACKKLRQYYAKLGFKNCRAPQDFLDGGLFMRY